MNDASVSAPRAVAALIVGMAFVCGGASAQVLSPNGSGVKAFFASQSDGYQDSDPTGASFGPAGVGPYSPGAPLPALPPAPTPSITAAGGNPFSTNGGGGWTFYFNDNLGTTTFTAAQSTIDDNYLTAPILTSDVAITIPQWRLFQMPAAPGYAYEQINFGSNYLITSNPGLGANPSPNFPVFINGQTAAPGAYAQFDGVIDYTWIPVSINTAGVLSQTGPATLLGTLSWTFLQPGGGSFNQTLLSSGSLAAAPAGDGMLVLTGEMWLAGDPFDMTVSLAPEPSLGFGVAACALIHQGLRRRRKIS